MSRPSEPQSAANLERHYGAPSDDKPTEPSRPRIVKVRVEGVGLAVPGGKSERFAAPVPRVPAPGERKKPSRRPSAPVPKVPPPPRRPSRPTRGRISSALDVLERAELAAYRAQDEIAGDVTQW